MTQHGVEGCSCSALPPASFHDSGVCVGGTNSKQLLAILSLSFLIPEKAIRSSHSSLFWLKEQNPFNRSYTEG